LNAVDKLNAAVAIELNARDFHRIDQPSEGGDRGGRRVFAGALVFADGEPIRAGARAKLLQRSADQAASAFQFGAGETDQQHRCKKYY